MGKTTKIPYVDSTCSPVRGCSGCELGDDCWAYQMCHRYAGKNPGWPKDFRKPQLYLDCLADLRKWPDLTGKNREAATDSKGRVVVPMKPWLHGMPRLVFLSDLGEMFDPALPPEWIARPWRDETRQTVLEFLASLPHVLIILTKQAERMYAFFEKFPCPPNVWLGVSVTSPDTEWRVDWLRNIKTRVRIISHEPAIDGPVEWNLDGIHWLITGGMSGPRAAPCDLAWLRSDRDQAKAAKVVWFCKQLGANPISANDDDWWLWLDRPDGKPETPFRLNINDSSGSDPTEWPEDLQDCREVPRPDAAKGASDEYKNNSQQLAAI